MAALNNPVQGRMASAEAKSGYTPAVGDLVTWDTAGDFQVKKSVANDLPAGIVRKLTDADTMSVELFSNGSIVYLPYSGTVARGDKVEADGSNNVRTDNANGTGKVIALDVPATNMCAVVW